MLEPAPAARRMLNDAKVGERSSAGSVGIDLQVAVVRNELGRFDVATVRPSDADADQVRDVDLRAAGRRIAQIPALVVRVRETSTEIWAVAESPAVPRA